ncbi:hypothetical protein [Sphingobium quisquiliarum]|nr:hypothetical protein [Sphingobium quisquiliarum]
MVVSFEANGVSAVPTTHSPGRHRAGLRTWIVIATHVRAVRSSVT